MPCRVVLCFVLLFALETYLVLTGNTDPDGLLMGTLCLCSLLIGHTFPHVYSTCRHCFSMAYWLMLFKTLRLATALAKVKFVIWLQLDVQSMQLKCKFR